LNHILIHFPALIQKQGEPTFLTVSPPKDLDTARGIYFVITNIYGAERMFTKSVPRFCDANTAATILRALNVDCEHPSKWTIDSVDQAGAFNVEDFMRQIYPHTELQRQIRVGDRDGDNMNFKLRHSEVDHSNRNSNYRDKSSNGLGPRTLPFQLEIPRPNLNSLTISESLEIPVATNRALGDRWNNNFNMDDRDVSDNDRPISPQTTPPQQSQAASLATDLPQAGHDQASSHSNLILPFRRRNIAASHGAFKKEILSYKKPETVSHRNDDDYVIVKMEPTWDRDSLASSDVICVTPKPSKRIRLIDLSEEQVDSCESHTIANPQVRTPDSLAITTTTSTSTTGSSAATNPTVRSRRGRPAASVKKHGLRAGSADLGLCNSINVEI
jgi:hypothetical protein